MADGNEPGSSQGGEEGSDNKFKELLEALVPRSGGRGDPRKDKKKHYAFWSSQPVTQFDESRGEVRK